MKIFTESDGYWGHKVNFVDENDVLVGYDMTQSCCERADWFIADTIAEYFPKELNQPKNLEEYRFDPEFFREINYLTNEERDWNVLDAGAVAVFRLTDGEEDKYLHLFNCHNGYYGHGFNVEHNGETINSGVL